MKNQFDRWQRSQITEKNLVLISEKVPLYTEKEILHFALRIFLFVIVLFQVTQLNTFFSK